MKILYLVCILFFVLRGCACWIATDCNSIVYALISSITIVSWYIAYKKKRERIQGSFVIMFGGLCLVQMIAVRLNIASVISFSVNLFAISTPFFIKRTGQKYLLEKTNEIFTIIVAISIIFHLLMLSDILPSDSMYMRGSYWYQNYGVYLYSDFYEYRFCGFCYEPGFFSHLLSALLLISGYNFRKISTIVYLIALFMTFSLGGYIITTVCWYFYYTLKRRNSFTRIIKKNIVYVFMIFLLYIFVSSYWNDGDNIVNDKIINRIEQEGERGLDGDIRQEQYTYLEWLNFLNSDKQLFGYGNELYKKTQSEFFDSASIKDFIVRCGFVGTIIQIFSVGFFIFRRHKLEYALSGYLIYFLDFLQHGYGIEMSMYSLVIMWVIYSTEVQEETKIKDLSA